MNANAHDYRWNSQLQEERWISCEDCRSWMMPLAKCEIEDEEFNPPSADGT